MNKFWKKYKEFIFIGIVPIIIFALLFFVAVPLFEDINDKFDSIEMKKADKEELQRKLGEFSELENQAKKIKRNYNMLEITLGEDQIVSFVQEMEKIAEESGNKITIETKDNIEDLKKNKNNKNKKGKETILNNLPSENYLYFRIKIEGKYNDLLKFIQKIENLKYYSDIIAFEISKEPPLSFYKKKLSRNTFNSKAVSKDNEEGEIEEDNNIYSILELLVYLKNEKN